MEVKVSYINTRHVPARRPSDPHPLCRRRALALTQGRGQGNLLTSALRDSEDSKDSSKECKDGEGEGGFQFQPCSHLLEPGWKREWCGHVAVNLVGRKISVLLGK